MYFYDAETELFISKSLLKGDVLSLYIVRKHLSWSLFTLSFNVRTRNIHNNGQYLSWDLKTAFISSRITLLGPYLLPCFGKYLVNAVFKLSLQVTSISNSLPQLLFLICDLPIFGSRTIIAPEENCPLTQL